MSNLKAAPFSESAIKVELDKARVRPVGTANSLGSAAEYRAQAADYDLIAETEPTLTWDARVRLARAAYALRIEADRLNGRNLQREKD